MTETSGREAVLEEALRPFAEYADRNRRLPADHIITQGSRFAKRQLTMGDCYAALDALASPSTQEPALSGGKVEEIAAIQWTGDNWREVYDFSRGGDRNLARVYGPHPDDSINIDTADGMKRVPKGDLVVRFRDGTLAVGSIAAALRTHAGESAAQFAGLARERREEELREDERLGKAMARAEAAELALTAERQRRESAEAALKAMADFTDSTGDPWDCPYCHDPMAWHNEPKEHDADCVFEVARQHFSRYAHADEPTTHLAQEPTP